MKADRIIFGEHGKPNRYIVDGKEVTAEQFAEAHPPQPIGNGAGLIAWKRPLKSDALAVHRSQIEEVKARNKRHGISVEYDPVDGRAILPDRETRRRLMAIEGCHDREGGYGDQTPEKGGYLDVNSSG